MTEEQEPKPESQSEDDEREEDEESFTRENFIRDLRKVAKPKD